MTAEGEPALAAVLVGWSASHHGAVHRERDDRGEGKSIAHTGECGRRCVVCKSERVSESSMGEVNE